MISSIYRMVYLPFRVLLNPINHQIKKVESISSTPETIHKQKASYKKIEIQPYKNDEPLIHNGISEIFRSGIYIGKGEYGEVRCIRNEYALKRFYVGKNHTSFREMKGFNKYYGEGESELFQDENGQTYLKMKYLPGETLDCLIKNNQLPCNSVRLFNDMIDRMKKRNVFHGDLTIRNIIYTGSSFHPIDIDDDGDSERLKRNIEQIIQKISYSLEKIYQSSLQTFQL